MNKFLSYSILTRSVLIEKYPIRIEIADFRFENDVEVVVSWWYTNFIGKIFHVRECYNGEFAEYSWLLYYKFSDFYTVVDEVKHKNYVILKKHCKQINKKSV